MKSPNSDSSSSPTGVSNETGSWFAFWMSRTLPGETPERRGDLRDGRLSSALLQQLALHPVELVDGLDGVDGHPDGASLIGDGPRDRLADPPGGVGGELVAQAIVELLDRPDEARDCLPG